jgi:hypothetical protein
MLDNQHLKSYFRAAKACLALDKCDEAIQVNNGDSHTLSAL